VAILNLPVIFGIDRGGLVEDGETHQGVFDIAYLRSIPTFTVLAPKDAVELRNMLFSALRKASGPLAIRFPRDKAVNPDAIVTAKFEEIDYTKWEILPPSLVDFKPGDQKEEQKSIVLLAYGSMVDIASSALEAITKKGIRPILVNARSAKPLDDKMLVRLFEEGPAKIVTLEEGALAGGFGSAVLTWAAERRLKQPHARQPQIACLGVPDHFVEHGARSILLADNQLSPEAVAQFVVDFARV